MKAASRTPKLGNKRGKAKDGFEQDLSEVLCPHSPSEIGLFRVTEVENFHNVLTSAKHLGRTKSSITPKTY